MSLLLLLLTLFQLEAAPPPQPPQQVVQAGVVLFVGEVNARRQLDPPRLIEGIAPFVGPSMDAMDRWTFGPQTPAGEPISITFLYRPRTTLPDSPFDIYIDTDCCPDRQRPALPARIVDPGYPVNSIGEGAVILYLSIDAGGRVEHIAVARQEPSLTEAAINAVRDWKFTAANVDGRLVRSSAIVVISFLRPVL